MLLTNMKMGKSNYPLHFWIFQNPKYIHIALKGAYQLNLLTVAKQAAHRLAENVFLVKIGSC